MKRKQRYVKIPVDVASNLWDFIFNCCIPHLEITPDFFYRWEEERIRDLAEFFEDKNIF